MNEAYRVHTTNSHEAVMSGGGGEEEVRQPSSPSNFNDSLFERAGGWVLLALFIILPVAFIPSVLIPFQFTKTALFATGVLLVFALFLIGQLKRGGIRVPLHVLAGTALLIPLVYFISALFSSPSLGVSLIGERVEIDTALFMLISTLALLMTVVLVRTREQILGSYMLLFIPFGLLAFHLGSRLLLGPEWLSFGLFTDLSSNALGKWNDVAIFFGLMCVLVLVTIEGLTLRFASKAVLWVILILSLFFLAVVNFLPVWYVLGFLSLALILFSVVRGRFKFSRAPALRHEQMEQARGSSSFVSVPALLTFLISLAFIMFGTVLGTALSDFFGVAHLEARPSWATTVNILQETYKENALLGSGPNTFTYQWAQFEPREVNSTIFWAVDFTAGIGTIPTAFVTTGIIGGAAWLLLLGVLMVSGVRTLLLRAVADPFSYYLSFSSFAAACFLWIFAIIYIPAVPVLVLAFLFTGLYLASLRHIPGALPERELVFTQSPRVGFAAVLGLTVFLIVAVSGIYMVGERYAAAYNFQQSLVAANVERDLTKAEAAVRRALAMSEQDRFHQLAAEIGVLNLNTVLNDESVSVEERRERFQEVLRETVQDAQRATELRPDNYQNWRTLGRVYQSVVPLQIQGTYDNAVRAYERALALAPENPALYLARAELEVLNGNREAAQAFISQALERKNNYTAAIFLLAQLQIDSGNVSEAIAAVEGATLLDPQNPVVFFQLGVLRYSRENWQGAIDALSRAVALNTDYANARYFLGLAFYQVGQRDRSIEQFERVRDLNPDNEEVVRILANLRAGNPPLAGFEPPIEPIEREDLPIEGE